MNFIKAAFKAYNEQLGFSVQSAVVSSIDPICNHSYFYYKKKSLYEGY